MSTGRHASPRAARTLPRFRRAEPRRRVRRLGRRSTLAFEPLEDRTLLSGDSLAFHNDFWPADVDNNLRVVAQDALYVINALSDGGSRALGDSGTEASGEAGSTSSGVSPTGFVDVSGDDKLTPADALSVINVLNGGEGETQPGDVVRYSLAVTDTAGVQLTDTNGDGIYDINKGDTFRISGYVQDMRGNAAMGVFNSYMDVLASNPNLITLRYGETQQLVLLPQTFGGTITGTFKLTFQGQTTQDIETQDVYDDDGILVKSRAQLIQEALTALSTVGVGNVEVTQSLTDANEFYIRFVNGMGERDVPGMTGDFSKLGSGQSGGVADNHFDADLSDSGTYSSSFLHVDPYLNGGAPEKVDTVPEAGSNLVGEVGGFPSLFKMASPAGRKKFFSVDIKATAVGQVDFSGDLATGRGHETLTYDPKGDPGSQIFDVDPSLIGFDYLNFATSPATTSDTPLRVLISDLPTVTINQAANQPDPTNALPVRFTVLFSEPVTGFTSEDVTLAGTAGATTAVVTGSGTAYEIVVSGMAHGGTVSASIVAGTAVNAAGIANAASTSTDNAVVFLPWQDPADAYDVDGNGGVEPLDVLLLINYINSHPDW